MKSINLLKIILFSISIIFGLILTIDKETEIKRKKEDDRKIEVYKKENRLITKNSYIGIIEIPKIKLRRGFYEINNKNNTIDKNITLLKKDKNTIILAAHSGNSSIAYFNEINKLNKKDIILIDYKHNKTKYEVYSKHLDKKDGQIEIEKDNKEKLILVTCNKNDKNNYLVIISYKKEYLNG